MIVRTTGLHYEWIRKCHILPQLFQKFEVTLWRENLLHFWVWPQEKCQEVNRDTTVRKLCHISNTDNRSKPTENTKSLASKTWTSQTNVYTDNCACYRFIGVLFITESQHISPWCCEIYINCWLSYWWRYIRKMGSITWSQIAFIDLSSAACTYSNTGGGGMQHYREGGKEEEKPVMLPAVHC